MQFDKLVGFDYVFRVCISRENYSLFIDVIAFWREFSEKFWVSVVVDRVYRRIYWFVCKSDNGKKNRTYSNSKAYI